MVVTPLRTLVASAWWCCRMTTRTGETRRRRIDVRVNRARRAAGARGGTRRAVGANQASFARRAAHALTVPARGTGCAGGLAYAGVRASAARLARRAWVSIVVSETGIALATGQPVALTVPARGTGRAEGLACAGVRASAARLARRAWVIIVVSETGIALGTGQPQGVARAPGAAAKARCAGVEVNVNSAVGTANATQSVLRESWVWAYVRPLSFCRC